MSIDFSEIPQWALEIPNYPVHTEPARAGGDILPPFTWQQMQEYFRRFMDAFLAQVAIALGGIEIAGWKPFEFLVWWGENSLQTGDPLNAEDLFNVIAENLIPGLDATKIISGLFPQSQIQNLEDDLSGLWDAILNLDFDAIVEAITGIVGGTTEDLENWSDNLHSMLGLPPWNDEAFDSLAAVEQFILDMINPTKRLAGMDPLTELIHDVNIPLLDASKIGSGQFLQSMVHELEDDLNDIWTQLEDATAAILAPITDWLLPNVPVSSVGLFNPELLSNPHYDTIESLDGGTDWIWDGAVDHDGDGTGSVRATCNGTVKQLLSDPSIQVSPNQILHLEHWLQWNAVSATGAAFKLSVAAFNNNVLAGTVDLQTIGSPAANSGWIKLQGNYTVPASGVNSIRLMLTINSTATAGTTWWDTGSVKKTQLFGQDFTLALPGDLSNLFTQVGARALLTDFNALMSNLGLGSPTLTAITNRLASLGSTGLFNSASLTNMTAFPGIDSSKILSGILNLARIPTSQFDRTNIVDLGNVLDEITNGLLGTGYTYDATTTTQARGGLDSIFRDVLNHTQQIQAMRSNTAGNDVSGSSVNINFSDYPDGELPAIFTTVYTGSGTSRLGIRSGVGKWAPANNDGNRNCHASYSPAPTNTDFQLIRGSLASIPQQGGSGGTPRVWVCGRQDSPTNPRYFVWARGYCTGFLTFKGDMGCTVNGVETVWASNIGLTWSMDIMMAFGVGVNARRYQVYSGSKLVYDYTEVGSASSLGAGFRYYGLKAEIRTDSGGTPTTPGELAGASISDNAPPSVVGSGAVMSRRNAATVGMPTGVNVLPSNFFGIVDAQSTDIACNLSNGSFTVTHAGWYHINLAVQLNGELYEDWNLYLYVNGVGVRMGGSTANQQSALSASWVMYLAAGDYVQGGTYRESGSNSVMRGEATGTWTYFQICLSNRSYA